MAALQRGDRQENNAKQHTSICASSPPNRTEVAAQRTQAPSPHPAPAPLRRWDPGRCSSPIREAVKGSQPPHRLEQPGCFLHRCAVDRMSASGKGRNAVRRPKCCHRSAPWCQHLPPVPGLGHTLFWSHCPGKLKWKTM